MQRHIRTLSNIYHRAFLRIWQGPQYASDILPKKATLDIAENSFKKYSYWCLFLSWWIFFDIRNSFSRKYRQLVTFLRSATFHGNFLFGHRTILKLVSIGITYLIHTKNLSENLYAHILNWWSHNFIWLTLFLNVNTFVIYIYHIFFRFFSNLSNYVLRFQ